MWVTATGWVVALLIALIGANALAPKSTRQLRRMRNEAELLALLPDGDEKDALDSHLAASVTRYVERDRLEEVYWLFVVLLFAGPVVVLPLALTHDPDQPMRKAPLWFLIPLIGGFCTALVGIVGVAVVSWLGFARSGRRLSKH